MVDLRTFGVAKGEGRYHEEIVYSIALLYSKMNNEITNFLKVYHLTPGKLNILITIKHKGGPEGIRQVDISKHLIVTASNMTKMIDKLEKERLVSRFAQPGDRRVRIIKISKKGSELLDTIWQGYNAQLKEVVCLLGKKDQEQLAGYLTRWLEKVK